MINMNDKRGIYYGTLGLASELLVRNLEMIYFQVL